jgi:catechol 2,3-dioxygenase
MTMTLSRRIVSEGGGAAILQGALPMTDVSSAQPSIAAVINVPLDPIRPATPTLIVRDLAKVARYYEETIGLQRIDAERDTVRLGAGGVVLLVLRQRANVDLEPVGFAGLFHTAFLMPTRADLGAWLHHAIKSGVAFDGASDHKVSEALYLTDPEGNGIEIYADRPRETWQWQGDQVVMATDPLDVKGLVAARATIGEGPARVADGTTVGHIHLRVGGISEAERFYRDVLGLDVMARRAGATFYATGRYHHHIATNVWQSQNAPKRSGRTTGLASFELLARDQGAFDTAAERLLAIGANRNGDTIEAADPWGNRVLLKRG